MFSCARDPHPDTQGDMVGWVTSELVKLDGKHVPRREGGGADS